MTNKLSTISFDSLCKLVDLDIGYFVAVFLAQSQRYKRKIAAGTTDNEEGNLQLADNLLGRTSASSDIESSSGSSSRSGASTKSRGCCSGGFLSMIAGCCFPETFQVSAVRGYTSTLNYYHCEVAFFTRFGVVKPGERSMIAVGVHNESAFIEARAYGTRKDDYEWVNVGCERESMLAMLALAIQMRGVRFSMTRMSRSAVIPGPHRDMSNWLNEGGEGDWFGDGGGDGGDGVFCSEMTMKLLSLLPHPVAQLNRPNAQTVDDIMAIVSRPEFHPRVGVTEAPRSQIHKAYGAHTTVKLAVPPPLRAPQSTSAATKGVPNGPYFV